MTQAVELIPAIITVFVLRDLRGAHSVPYTINDETCIIQY